MAERSKKPIQVGDIVEAPKGDREARFKKFVEAYAIANPIKYASKKANKEFDKIPDSFK